MRAAALPQPAQTEAGAEAWYAVHTRSRFEKRVAADAAAKQIGAYLPLARSVRRWKDRMKVVELPVFSCYVFLRFTDCEETRLSVLRTAGVLRILGDSRGPEPIPDEQIEAVRRIVAGRPFAVHPLLREGAPVRVIRGPLKGVEGLFVRSKSAGRLVVSLPLLSQSISAEIDADDIEPLQQNARRVNPAC